MNKTIVRSSLLLIGLALVGATVHEAATPNDQLGYRMRSMNKNERDGSTKQFGEEPRDVILGAGEKKLIENALTLIQSRFRTLKVIQNERANSKRWWVSPDYWAKIGLTEKDAPRIGMNLLGYQIYYLSHNRFPPINIIPYHSKKDPAIARGTIGCVVTKYGGRAAKDVTGEFEVFLNMRVIRDRKDIANADTLAGIIAHEMLHNLGHLHGEGDYKEDLQINAFMNSVRTNGAFRAKDKCPYFRCGK